MSVDLSPITNASIGHTGSDRDPKKIHTASVQFESLLIGEMLKEVRAAGSDGYLDGSEDSAGSSAMDMAQEFLAQNIASSGGLGLASTIEKGLQSSVQQNAPASTATPKS